MRFLLLSLVLFLGCRSSSNTPSGDVDAGGGNVSDDLTIQEIQSDSMPPNTAVTVRGVVVVAIDTYGDRTGGIYVMEPEGGANSGVFVFLRGTEAASISVGDLVDLEGGEKIEFALTADTSGRTLTEISPPQNGAITVTKVGDGTVPAPHILTLEEIADEAMLETWEGVLVTVNDVRLFGTPTGDVEDQKRAFITGPLELQSSLTSVDSLAQDDCVASITGIIDYFFSYKIIPRTAADIGAASTNCLANEAIGDCMDMEDNDKDGFSDCADFSCQETVQACFTNETVSGVQSDAVPEDTLVAIDGVVTAVKGSSFYVQNYPIVDTPHNGLFIYQNSSKTLPPEIEIGRRVSVNGKFIKFKGLSEITNPPTIVPSTDTLSNPAIISGATIPVVRDVTMGAAFESALVELEGPIVNAAAGSGFTIGVAGTELFVDDDIYDWTTGATPFTPVQGACVSVRGIVTLNNFDADPANWNHELSPRLAADIQPCTQ